MVHFKPLHPAHVYGALWCHFKPQSGIYSDPVREEVLVSQDPKASTEPLTK